MFACQQYLLHLNGLEKAVLNFICQQSKSLYNIPLCEVRERDFKSSKLVIDDDGKIRRRYGNLMGYSFLDKKLKPHKNYPRNLYAQSAQQRWKILAESIQSINNSALLSKVSTILNLNLDLSIVSRGCLTIPTRVKLWLVKKKNSNIDGVLTRQFYSS
ncbi:MAG: hypothetical protein F6K10_06700 [Moorea sp. SIO2B7]|nr:hypothetical protein [Moorena sp. SIO2B7]